MLQVFVAVAGALAVGLLLNAGLYKLVDPQGLQGALGELSSRLTGAAGESVVRFAAVAEIITAILLVVPEGKLAGALGGAVLGAAFAALGAAGWVRGSRVPCGCLGRSSGRPLGGANIVIGLSLAAAMLLCLWQRPVISPIWAALFALAIPLWSNRGLARRLLGKGNA